MVIQKRRNSLKLKKSKRRNTLKLKKSKRRNSLKRRKMYRGGEGRALDLVGNLTYDQIYSRCLNSNQTYILKPNKDVGFYSDSGHSLLQRPLSEISSGNIPTESKKAVDAPGEQGRDYVLGIWSKKDKGSSPEENIYLLFIFPKSNFHTDDTIRGVFGWAPLGVVLGFRISDLYRSLWSGYLKPWPDDRGDTLRQRDDTVEGRCIKIMVTFYRKIDSLQACRELISRINEWNPNISGEIIVRERQSDPMPLPQADQVNVSIEGSPPKKTSESSVGPQDTEQESMGAASAVPRTAADATDTDPQGTGQESMGAASAVLRTAVDATDTDPRKNVPYVEGEIVTVNHRDTSTGTTRIRLTSDGEEVDVPWSTPKFNAIIVNPKIEFSASKELVEIKYMRAKEDLLDEGYWARGRWVARWVESGEIKAMGEKGSYTNVKYDRAKIISPVKDLLLNDVSHFPCELLAQKKPSFHENEIVRLSTTKKKINGILVGPALNPESLTVKILKRGTRYEFMYCDISSIHKFLTPFLIGEEVVYLGKTHNTLARERENELKGMVRTWGHDSLIKEAQKHSIKYDELWPELPEYSVGEEVMVRDQEENPWMKATIVRDLRIDLGPGTVVDLRKSARDKRTRMNRWFRVSLDGHEGDWPYDIIHPTYENKGWQQNVIEAIIEEEKKERQRKPETAVTVKALVAGETDRLWVAEESGTTYDVEIESLRKITAEKVHLLYGRNADTKQIRNASTPEEIRRLCGHSWS